MTSYIPKSIALKKIENEHLYLAIKNFVCGGRIHSLERPARPVQLKNSKVIDGRPIELSLRDKHNSNLIAPNR